MRSRYVCVTEGHGYSPPLTHGERWRVFGDSPEHKYIPTCRTVTKTAARSTQKPHLEQGTWCLDETPYGWSFVNAHNRSNILPIWHVRRLEGRSGSRPCVCLQKHHPAALSDHHPGEEIPQSPDVPAGPAESLRGGQSQVGGAAKHPLPDFQLLLLFTFPLGVKPSPLLLRSMTELEKDIGNMRSGLRSVESVSHSDLPHN